MKHLIAILVPLLVSAGAPFAANHRVLAPTRARRPNLSHRPVPTSTPAPSAIPILGPVLAPILAPIFAPLFAITLVAAPAVAEELGIPQPHIAAIACTENMGGTTTWGQCLNLIFSECPTDQVGSDSHLACLDTSRKSWGATVEALQKQVTEVITTEASVELANLQSQWTGFVVQKCQAVAAEKPQSGQEAARLGCAITEMVGLSAELDACLKGRTTADYCRRP